MIIDTNYLHYSTFSPPLFLKKFQPWCQHAFIFNFFVKIPNCASSEHLKHPPRVALTVSFIYLYICSTYHQHHHSAVVSKTSASRFQSCQSYATLCQMVSFHRVSVLSLHIMAGRPSDLFLPHRRKLVTRNTNRSSWKQLSVLSRTIFVLSCFGICQ